MATQEGEPFFADVVNPRPDELRAWAYADAFEPMQDFHMLLDGPDVLPVVVECAADPACAARRYLLTSLYCSVGHASAADTARMRAVAAAALESADPAVRTWARRAVAVLDGEQPLDRADWCGWNSLAVTHPVDG